MDNTNEFRDEICQLINLASNYNAQITRYVRHYMTLQPCNGFRIELEGNRSVFISRYLLQDYSKCPQSISENDIKNIAESLIIIQ